MAATGLHYKRYLIVLSDIDLLAKYQFQFNGNGGLPISPAAAAITYGAPIWDGTGAKPSAPYIDLGGLPLTSILTANIESATYGAGFTVDGGGTLHALAGAAGGTLFWNGLFGGANNPNSFTSSQALMPRRFGTGFEIPASTPTTAGANVSVPTFVGTRSASRTSEGFGYAYRSESIGGTGVSATLLANQQHSWERFYLCPRKYSTGGINQDSFWWAENSGQAAFPALLLHLDSTGHLKLYNQGNAAFPGTLIGTSSAVLALNQFAKIDLLFSMSSVVLTGNASLFINGVLQFTVNGNAGQGIAVNGFHTSSHIEQTSTGGVYQGLELDIDDWTNSDRPATLTGLDWTSGSHYKLVHPTGFGSTHSSNWVGDYRSLATNPANAEQNITDNLNALTLTGSGAVPIHITTDYQDEQLGCISINVVVASKTTSVAGNTIALSGGVSSGAQVIPSIPAASAGNKLFTTGGLVIADRYPLELIYTASATTAQKVIGFQAECEFLGTWGPEDEDSIQYPNLNVHNSPYPNSEWAKEIGNAHDILGPVAVVSGTYVGNGTGQTINTAVPIHWWWVRPVGTGQPGGFWFSSLTSGRAVLVDIPAPHKGGIKAYQSVDGTGQFDVAGSNASVNANGVTYQWVGFSDPAMRYLLNGAFAHKNAIASATNNLVDSSFLPQGTFLVKERANGGTNDFYFKGPGNATDTADLLDTGTTATVASIATGIITTKTALHQSLPGGAYSAWRKDDGIATGTIDILTYTGNGAGTRVITLALGGRSPLFAIVSPSTSAAAFRDPSHLTTHSSVLNGSDTTTAIIGGDANQITVASAFNVNAVVYEVFVIAGSVQSGWSPNSGSIFTSDTPSIATSPAFLSTDTGGWWRSSNGFLGGADLVATPLVPKHPRAWDKLAPFTGGTNAGVLGGSPSATASVKNHFIYPGDAYTQGTNEPPIRIFDGLSDRLMTTLPSIAGVPPKAIVSIFQNAGTIYLSTLDSGTSASDFAGRVFTFDPNSGVLVQVGTQFTGGEVPYAFEWHEGRLWLGTNKGNGTAGKVYFFRPGIDTAWTQDRSLSTDSLGGVCSLKSFQGKLYVGSDNVGGASAKVIVRTSDGTYSSTLTGAGTGTYNGFLTLGVFQNNLYASYWDASPIALIKKFDGTTWSTVFTGSGSNQLPYTAQFQWNSNLYFSGGGKVGGAVLLNTLNGTTYTDLTPNLPGNLLTETSVVVIGMAGA